MRACYGLVILLASLFLVSFASASDLGSAEGAVAELPASTPDRSETEEVVSEDAVSEANAGEVASELLGGESKLLACEPEDPDYCESAGDCSPGCICRLNCCALD